MWRREVSRPDLINLIHLTFPPVTTFQPGVYDVSYHPIVSVRLFSCDSRAFFQALTPNCVIIKPLSYFRPFPLFMSISPVKTHPGSEVGRKASRYYCGRWSKGNDREKAEKKAWGAAWLSEVLNPAGCLLYKLGHNPLVLSWLLRYICININIHADTHIITTATRLIFSVYVHPSFTKSYTRAVITKLGSGTPLEG